MVSFKGYLEMCRFQNSPEADFVQTALADGRIHDAGSWEELRAYLENERKFSAREMQAAHNIWQDFQRSP